MVNQTILVRNSVNVPYDKFLNFCKKNGFDVFPESSDKTVKDLIDNRRIDGVTYYSDRIRFDVKDGFYSAGLFMREVIFLFAEIETNFLIYVSAEDVDYDYAKEKLNRGLYYVMPAASDGDIIRYARIKWARDVYEYYKENLNVLSRKDPEEFKRAIEQDIFDIARSDVVLVTVDGETVNTTSYKLGIRG